MRIPSPLSRSLAALGTREGACALAVNVHACTPIERVWIASLVSRVRAKLVVYFACIPRVR